MIEFFLCWRKVIYSSSLGIPMRRSLWKQRSILHEEKLNKPFDYWHTKSLLIHSFIPFNIRKVLKSNKEPQITTT